MGYITKDDFIESYVKLKQRGSQFLLSKFNWNKKARTRSAFNTQTIDTSNWWDIPMVNERWNQFISEDPKVNYRQFLMQTLLKDKRELRLLSLGSGSCTQELELASYDNFVKIVCVDIAENRLKEAAEIAKSQGVADRMEFVCKDVYQMDLGSGSFDLVLFNSSLHHFKNIEQLITTKVIPCLTRSGHMIINEYVGPNRLQFPRHQIQAINSAIRAIDKRYRKRYQTNILKSSYSGPGRWRMIIADPSECVESERIMPLIHKYFDTTLEKPFGGNILMGVLKDLAYQFINPNEEERRILKDLFAKEDAYLDTHPSDYVF